MHEVWKNHAPNFDTFIINSCHDVFSYSRFSPPQSRILPLFFSITYFPKGICLWALQFIKGCPPHKKRTTQTCKRCSGSSKEEWVHDKGRVRDKVEPWQQSSLLLHFMEVHPGIQRERWLWESWLWPLSAPCSAAPGGTEPTSTLLPPELGTPKAPLYLRLHKRQGTRWQKQRVIHEQKSCPLLVILQETWSIKLQI